MNVQLNPFNTEELLIFVSNPQGEVVNYPGFKVYENGELIGTEEVLFFGIASSSTHRVQLTNLPEEGEVVSYQLELWSGFYGELVCTYDISGIPFDSESCVDVTLQIFASGAGSNMQLSLEETFSNTLIIEEDVILNSTNPVYTENVCLEKGCYAYDLSTTSGVFSSNVFLEFNGIGGFGYLNSIGQAGGNMLSGTFSIWDGCTTWVEELDDYPLFYPNPIRTQNRIYFPHFSTFQVMDASGRLVYAGAGNSALIDLKSGVYFLVVDKKADKMIIID
jgi:hypothetical protein